MDNKLNEWKERLNEAQTGHYAASEKFSRINNLLGLPLVILSSFVSAFLFFDQNTYYLSVFLKVAGLLVAVLASIQTFIRPSEKSEQHRFKATKYGGLKRKVEIFLIKHQEQESPKSQEFFDFCKEVVMEWNSIAEDSPVTPQHIRDKAKVISDND